MDCRVKPGNDAMRVVAPCTLLVVHIWIVRFATAMAASLTASDSVGCA